MYQGKFSAKGKGQQTPGDALDQILNDRENANAARAARKAQKADAQSLEKSLREAVDGTPLTDAPAEKKPKPPVAKVPAAKAPEGKAPEAKAKRPAPAPAQKPARPQKPVAENQKAQSTGRRGPRLGGVIFYTFYFFMIFAFFAAVLVGLYWLNGWLKAYQDAQPTVICQEVFDQLFKDPDWARIYRLAGQQPDGKNIYDTDFDDVNTYVTYMQNKVGGQELNYVATSAGISNNKKYIVRLDKEKIATFELEGDGQTLTDIPNWRMGKVELFFTRDESVTIRMLENRVAYVNNVSLDDSYTIQRSYTKADDLLLSNNKVRTTVQTVSGLLTKPDLVVYDQTGRPIDVRYNPESGMYEEQDETIVMTDAERNAVFGALESFGGFMINAGGSSKGLATYYDTSSSIYQEIVAMGKELWMNADRGHEFLDEEILGYTKHSSDVFSTRASLRMHVNCKDGTEKDYDMLESMFFKLKDGKWVCYDMINEDITQPIGEVRLTFCDNAGNVLLSKFFDTNAESIVVPMGFTVPDGKVFSGWSCVEVGADGTKTWSIKFRPDEYGNVYLNPNYALEPMTLYPLFENA